MAEAALKKLEDQLNCLVCLDTYTDPKQLQCHHVFCCKCLVPLVVRDQQGQLTLTCPTCRQVTPVPAKGVAGLQSAFQTSKLLEIVEEHKKLRGNVLYCANHQERELELYCETCESLICLECTIANHNGHKYNLVKQVFEKHKEELKTSLAPVETQLAAIQSALKEVRATYVEIFDQQTTLEAKIYLESQQLIDAINARTEEHISKVQHMTEQKLRQLASQQEQMEVTMTQLSSYLTMVRETLSSGGEGEVMNIRATMNRQVKELTVSLQMDTLQPITQADVEFSTSNKIIEECQNYGLVYISPSNCEL